MIGLSMLLAMLVAGSGSGPTVAVLGFQGTRLDSAESAVLRDAVAVELQASGKVRVLERERLDLVLAEQGFQQAVGCQASECAVEVGRLAGVERIALGSVGRLGDTWSATLRLVDVATGEILASARDDRTGDPGVLLRESVPALVGGVLASRSAPGGATEPESAPESERLFLARRLVERREQLSDAGLQRLRRLAAPLPAEQRAWLLEKGEVSPAWAALNATWIPVGSAVQHDWRGVGYSSASFLATYVSAVVDLFGIANGTRTGLSLRTGLMALASYGFTVGRPIWYAGRVEDRLNEGLFPDGSGMSLPTLVPVPSPRGDGAGLALVWGL